MKNNSKIGQELSELKPVELVGYEDEEAGNPCPFRAGYFTLSIDLARGRLIILTNHHTIFWFVTGAEAER